MDRGAWWTSVHRVAKSRTRLSTHMSQLLCTAGLGLVWGGRRLRLTLCGQADRSAHP